MNNLMLNHWTLTSMIMGLSPVHDTVCVSLRGRPDTILTGEREG